MVADQKIALERTAYTAARWVSAPTVELSLLTKDSQRVTDSQLEDQLFQILSQLKISGSLTLVDFRGDPFRVVNSTKVGVRKTDFFRAPQGLKGNFRTDVLLTSDLYREGTNFWMSATAPVLGA